MLRSEVRRVHALSQGSAGARTNADMVSSDGTLLSRYRAGNIMKELGLVSCQTRTHAYKKGYVPVTCCMANLEVGHHPEGLNHGYPSLPTSIVSVPVTDLAPAATCSA